MKLFPVIVAAIAAFGPGVATAEWCDPPIAPELTTPELAQEYREEFKDEFDQYFRDASRYAACLDAERTRIFEEMQITARRYERFLNDARTWGGLVPVWFRSLSSNVCYEANKKWQRDTLMSFGVMGQGSRPPVA